MVQAKGLRARCTAFTCCWRFDLWKQNIDRIKIHCKKIGEYFSLRLPSWNKWIDSIIQYHITHEHLSVTSCIGLKSFVYYLTKLEVEKIERICLQQLTDENVCEQPLKSHLILSELTTGSWIRRCRLMFFFSCLVPHISQVICWWQDWRWALRHCSLLNDFKQPGSVQNASTESNLTAIKRSTSELHISQVHQRKNANVIMYSPTHIFHPKEQ